jgi:hypothetical protein
MRLKTLRDSWRPTCLFIVLLPAAATAQPVQEAAPKKTETLVAGKQYAAGPFWSFFFGKDWRDLWTAPVVVPVLDAETFAGGLEATKASSGRQTRSLSFKGRNGRDYKFRSIDKDPSDALPQELRGGQLEDIAQDQTSSGLPGAALVVEPLVRAAGLPQVRWRMVVLPDSPRLGEFRKEFAGMLGTIEDDPESEDPQKTPGFETFARIVESEELYKLLRESAAEQVDTRAYLRARLIDFYVGDWDRHYRQWDWGKSETDGRWKPIPKDRDQAFSRYDGLIVGLAAGGRGVTVFRNKYGDPIGNNWVARELDRRFFAGLSAEVWDEQAKDLAQRFTDPVLEAAVKRMPPEYYDRRGAEILRILKVRRDELPRMARRWYGRHADDVDVFASDEDERLHAVHSVEGLDLSLVRKGAAEPYFKRRFRAGETEEVRVYLAGGTDQAVVQGTSAVKLRIVGGPGNDVLDDTQGGSTRFYDAEGGNVIRRGGHTRVGTRPWKEPDSPKEERPRDWGATWSTPLWLTASGDIGVFVGAGIQRVGYGFRRDPFSSRQLLRGGYATAAQKFRFEYLGEFRRVQTASRIEVAARASGIEVLRFFGFGNETTNVGGDDFFKATQQQYTLSPSLSLPLGPVARLRIGPKLRYSSTRSGADRFIGQARPYGFGNFGEAGVAGSLAWDTRDHHSAPHKGLLAFVGGSVFPAVWSVEKTFGEVHGETAAYLTAPVPFHPTLALRVGGKQTFGDYPYFEAAFIGGSRREASVRGLRGQRYAGDASAYGNAELRLKLFDVALLVPTNVGIFGLADAGRVFFSGETSDRWHRAVGGGFWIAPVDRRNTVAFYAARSEGRTAYYFHAGFLF